MTKPRATFVINAVVDNGECVFDVILSRYNHSRVETDLNSAQVIELVTAWMTATIADGCYPRKV